MKCFSQPAQRSSSMWIQSRFIVIIVWLIFLTTTTQLLLPKNQILHHHHHHHKQRTDMNKFEKYHRINIRSAHSRHYCGSQLTEIMQLICGGEYFSPIQMDKRNGFNNHKPPTQSKSNHNSGHFLLKILKGTRDRDFGDDNGNLNDNLNGNFIRNIRGLADECCAKKCSIRELSEYCAQPSEE